MSMRIITSILDNDKYSFTQQQAVLEHYPNVNVSYCFNNRGDTKFSKEFLELFTSQVSSMSYLRMTDSEYEWVKATQTELKPMYLEYLRNFRFNPEELSINLDNGQLIITINGPWHRTILWEVPLMSLICECYSQTQCDKLDFLAYENKTIEKRNTLMTGNCVFADFGTRRRFSYETQKRVVKVLSESPNFVGTSNMHFAMMYGTKAIGTQSHQWIMGISALETLRYANRKAMQRWYQTYDGRLGIVLTDTFGTDDFLDHFNDFNARLYDGVRHDSGDPYDFADKIINHYKSLNIDPNSKTIVFSDGLNVETATKIRKYCDGKIRCSFGIGTHFSNDTDKSLNIVIKLRTVNNINVVKISDNPIKATGEESALAVAMSVFHGKKIAMCE